MDKLIRFGISMSNKLLHEFDHMITHNGYNNRSEAIRDIVRNKLVEESVQLPKGNVYGALVYIYDHHKREVEKSLANIQHEYFKNIISTSHVHVDQDSCLEVALLRGKVETLKTISEKILSFNGVKHGKLIMTTSLSQHTHHKHLSKSSKAQAH